MIRRLEAIRASLLMPEATSGTYEGVGGVAMLVVVVTLAI